MAVVRIATWVVQSFAAARWGLLVVLMDTMIFSGALLGRSSRHANSTYSVTLGGRSSPFAPALRRHASPGSLAGTSRRIGLLLSCGSNSIRVTCRLHGTTVTGPFP